MIKGCQGHYNLYLPFVVPAFNAFGAVQLKKYEHTTKDFLCRIKIETTQWRATLQGAWVGPLKIFF